MTELSKLKPCTFCGGVAEIKPYRRDGIVIKCTQCLIQKKQRVLRNSLEWLEEKMIADWNDRPYHRKKIEQAYISAYNNGLIAGGMPKVFGEEHQRTNKDQWIKDNL